MRVFEAILDANHRALAGDATAGLRSADFADSLPIAALTCIDPRLNSLFPEVLGVTKENFVWSRNAGNIIFGPMSTMMRSLALACAVKGAKELAIIGHTDCQVSKTSTMKLTEAFRALGVERHQLPENLTEFFGLFASERQNVIKAVDFARQSPLIGSKVPVHGLIVDVETGKLEWVVNGYQAMTSVTATHTGGNTLMNETPDALRSLAAFKIGEMKFPDTKIGEIATEAKDWLVREIQPSAAPQTEPAASPQSPSPQTPLPLAVPPMPPPPRPQKIPTPPRARPFNYPKE